MVKVTPRTLADWTPEAREVDAWLEQWAAAGWVPEYTWSGTLVVVNGRTVHRFAMIAAPRPEPVDR